MIKDRISSNKENVLSSLPLDILILPCSVYGRNMQIHAHPSCSKFQRVRFEGRTYELTRVGFGLACAPQILKAVVQYVLSLDKTIQRACNAYYDDILVDLNQVSEAQLANHLQKFGLIAKPP